MVKRVRVRECVVLWRRDDEVLVLVGSGQDHQLKMSQSSASGSDVTVGSHGNGSDKTVVSSLPYVSVVRVGGSYVYVLRRVWLRVVVVLRVRVRLLRLRLDDEVDVVVSHHQ